MANKLNLITLHGERGSTPTPYTISVLIGLDQLINTIFMGSPDETISSRAYRCNHLRRWAFAEKVINTIFFFDREGDIKHCQLAYLGEVALSHFPKDFDNKFRETNTNSGEQ